MSDVSEDLIEVDTVSGRSKIKRTLQFDPSILCSRCDGQIGKYDEVLGSFVKSWVKHPDRDVEREFADDLVVVRQPCHVPSLVISLAAILLRFSFSGRYPEFDLGRYYEQMFSEWVRSGSLPEDVDRLFSIILIGYSADVIVSAEGRDPYDMSRVMRGQPRGGRFGHAHIYSFELPSLFFAAKVGKGGWPSRLRGYPTLENYTDEVEIPCVPFRKSMTLYEVGNSVKTNRAWIDRQRAKRARR